MPIEVQIEKTHGKNLPAAETQRLCRAYATEQIERQKKDFQRLGVLGDWDHPYTTMDFRNEADEIRTLGKLLEKGYLYRGLKPVNWCFDCGTRAGRSRGRVRGPRRHRRSTSAFRSPSASARSLPRHSASQRSPTDRVRA